jgi:hypothetical protein
MVDERLKHVSIAVKEITLLFDERGDAVRIRLGPGTAT